jgi:hypothetical protein
MNRSQTSSLARVAAARLSTAKELSVLLVENGRWWLIPMLGILFGTALLLAAIQIAEYVAPFVYSIF